MKWSILFSTVAAAAASASEALEARQDPAPFNLLVCTEPNGGGECTFGPYVIYKCNPLSGAFFKNVGTFALDRDGFHCALNRHGCEVPCTSNAGCGSVSFDAASANSYDVKALDIGHEAKSFHCFYRNIGT